jgi:hypothetical protein
MMYARNVLVKLILLPVALVFFIPAYIGFAFHPEFRRFTYKLER